MSEVVRDARDGQEKDACCPPRTLNYNSLCRVGYCRACNSLPLNTIKFGASYQTGITCDWLLTALIQLQKAFIGLEYFSTKDASPIIVNERQTELGIK
jgi:hypothetical protein